MKGISVQTAKTAGVGKAAESSHADEKTLNQRTDGEIGRLALAYSDGSFGVLHQGITAEEAWAEAEFADKNEKDPRHLTKVVRVRVEVIEIVHRSGDVIESFCKACGRPSTS